MIRAEINAMWEFLKDSGWFSDGFFTREETSTGHPTKQISRIQKTLEAARSAQEELAMMSRSLNSKVLDRLLQLENRVCWTDCPDELLEILKRLLTALREFRNEPRFVSFYGELFSVYL